ALLAAVAPVREAAARQLTWRRAGASAFLLAVHPEHFSGCGIERENRAAASAGCVEDAADHQRRSLVLILRTRAKAVGLEPPRDLELVEVGRVDLIGWGVCGTARVAGVAAPFAAFCAGLRVERRRETEQGDDGEYFLHGVLAHGIRETARATAIVQAALTFNLLSTFYFVLST